MNLLLEGDDLEALLLRAHREGGTSARIVRAEKVRRGGVLGFFAKEGFEVAVEIATSGDPDFAPLPEQLPSPDPASPATPAQAEPGEAFEQVARAVRQAAAPTTLLDLVERTSAAERAASRAVALQAAYSSTTMTMPFAPVPQVISGTPSTDPSPDDGFASAGSPSPTGTFGGPDLPPVRAAEPVPFAPIEFPKAQLPGEQPRPSRPGPLDSDWSAHPLTLNDVGFAADVPGVTDPSAVHQAAVGETAGPSLGAVIGAGGPAWDADLWFDTDPAIPPPLRPEVDAPGDGSPRPQFTHLIDQLRGGVGLGRQRSGRAGSALDDLDQPHDQEEDEAADDEAHRQAIEDALAGYPSLEIEPEAQPEIRPKAQTRPEPEPGTETEPETKAEPETELVRPRAATEARASAPKRTASRPAVPKQTRQAKQAKQSGQGNAQASQVGVQASQVGVQASQVGAVAPTVEPVTEDIEPTAEPLVSEMVEMVSDIVSVEARSPERSAGIPSVGPGMPRATTVVPRHKPRRGSSGKALPAPRASIDDQPDSDVADRIARRFGDEPGMGSDDGGQPDHIGGRRAWTDHGQGERPDLGDVDLGIEPNGDDDRTDGVRTSEAAWRLLRGWRPGARRRAATAFVDAATHDAVPAASALIGSIDQLAADREALRALGVPAAWTRHLDEGDRFTSIVSMLGRLAELKIEDDVAVIAVIGPADVVELEAHRTALELPVEGRPRAVVLVPAEGGLERRNAIARSKRIRPVVISVPITGYDDPAGTRKLLAGIQAEAVIAVVDARRSLEEITRWVEALERVDAIALDGALDVECPAAVLGLDVPVIRVDGIAVDRIGWAALLCAQLSAGEDSR